MTLQVDYKEIVNPMTKLDKSLWLRALRSGEYEQCQEQLCKVSDYLHEDEPQAKAYCCLGVANDVFKLGQANYAANIGFNLLPIDVQNQLAEMNDHGQTFTEIADFIEANVPAVDEILVKE